MTPLDASGPYSADPGPTSTSIPARSSFGSGVKAPTGSPFSGRTAMRLSSIISMRLLNEELKPRAFTATDVTPTWMKSSPFTALSAGANELPTVFSMAEASMRVIVAGASVIFSGRRDADTTIPASSSAALGRATSTCVSWPGWTTTPETVWATCPMRCACRLYVPGATPVITKCPPSSVIARPREPDRVTCAPTSGACAESVTVPLIRPACAAAVVVRATVNRMALRTQSTVVNDLLRMDIGTSPWGNGSSGKTIVMWSRGRTRVRLLIRIKVGYWQLIRIGSPRLSSFF